MAIRRALYSFFATLLCPDEEDPSVAGEQGIRDQAARDQADQEIERLRSELESAMDAQQEMFGRASDVIRSAASMLNAMNEARDAEMSPPWMSGAEGHVDLPGVFPGGIHLDLSGMAQVHVDDEDDEEAREIEEALQELEEDEEIAKDEEAIREAEAYLKSYRDRVDHLPKHEADRIRRHSFGLHDSFQKSSKHDPLGRPMVIPFVDEAGSPILRLFGKEATIGPSIKVILPSARIPSGMRLRLQGLRVKVHGGHGTVGSKEDRLSFAELDHESPDRSALVRILARALRVDDEEITGEDVHRAFHALTRLRRPSGQRVLVCAHDLRLDDGGNLLPQRGWNPITEDADEPFALRARPLLMHLDEDHRLEMRLALGALGEERSEPLVCTVSAVLTIEHDEGL